MLPAPETALAGTKKRVASSRAGPGQEVHTQDERQERRGEERREEQRRKEQRREDGTGKRDLGRITRPIETRKRDERQEKKHRRLESKRARARKEEREGSSMRYVRKRIYSRSYLSLSLHPPPSPFLPAYLRYFVFCDVSLISPE